MAKKTPKTVEQLEAELRTLDEACEADRTARHALVEAYRQACQAAREVGQPRPANPQENWDWAATRKLERRRSAAQAAVTKARRATDPTFAGGAKPTLRVATEHGTFERTTHRRYTHLIIARETEASIRRRLVASIATDEQQMAKYRAKLPLCDANGDFVETRPGFQGDGKPWTIVHHYREYIENCEKRIARTREELAKLSGPGAWYAARWSQSYRNALGGVREIQSSKYVTSECKVYEIANGKQVL